VLTLWGKIASLGGKAMNNLGDRIYSERKRMGLSQSDLATKMDVSAKAVSKWETGEAQPTLDNVSRLAGIFGVTTDYLLTGAGASGSEGGNKSGFKYLEPQNKTKKTLRILGWVFSGIGVFSLGLGALFFFSNMFSMNSGYPGIGGGITGVIFFGIGGFLTVIGFAFLLFGYMGSVSRYTASQTAPVAKDTTNYMLDGTRDEFSKSIASVVGAVKTDGAAPVSGSLPKCPKCGTINEKGAKFCDHCGAPLTKVCPKCGEVNDADALHCRHCGNLLN